MEGAAGGVSARRGRDMASVGMTAEDRIHQLQQMRGRTSPAESYTPALLTQSMAASLTLSDRNLSEIQASPKLESSFVNASEDKALSPAVGSSRASPVPRMSPVIHKLNTTLSPTAGAVKGRASPEGLTKLDLGAGVSSPHPVSSPNLSSGSSKRHTPGSPSDGKGHLGEASGERNVLMENFRQHFMQLQESGSHSSTPREQDTKFRRRTLSRDPRDVDRIHTGGNTPADIASRNQSPILKSRHFELLPETRRKSIEVRARSSLEYSRIEFTHTGVGSANEFAQSGSRKHLTNEQKTELVALEVLQDVTSSGISADTARQLEYLLESLEPFSEAPLSVRGMDAVEALATILRRKLIALRDMEFVRPPYSASFSHLLTFYTCS